VWETSRRREQEAELLFVGNQFRQAIGQYYAGSPSSDKHYPMSLEDLLKDKRSPNTRRYLRKIYRDPLTNSTQWGLVMAEEGGIQGVYSTAQGTPIKMTGFPTENADFEKTKSYTEWKFVYVPDGSDTSANTEESDGSEAPVDDNSFYN
jgi:type II secretory pathway pseudopilin PulG